MVDDYSFALCLTHDVDRPYKTYQSVYYAVRDRQFSHLADAFPGRNPYWQFDEIMSLEEDLGVRSAFYFLNEPHLLQKNPRSWVTPTDWVQHLGRYDIGDPAIAEVIHRLDAEGWEVGLHGSYRSYDDPDRLQHEKRELENCLESPILGGRQHYLNLAVPETWQYHTEIGLRYDASLGSGTTSGFQYGYDVIRPFDDPFVVFPLTAMEVALSDPSVNYTDAWKECEELLGEAAANEAVMTVLWHPRYFAESDFPGYRTLYHQLIERALEMDAWVGPPAEYYRELNLDGATPELPL